MVAARNLDLDQVRRLERGLAAVRWFGVAFAFFQVWQSVNAHPTPPEASLPRGYAIAAALALGNFVISLLLRRCRTIEQARRIGLAAFALDIAVIVGMIWNYSYWAYGTSWVIAYILPLEGAIRYQLRGALTATGISAVSEVLREVYLNHTLHHYHSNIS